jgi:hypothetical protein
MQAGARYFLTYPPDPDEYRTTFKKVAANIRAAIARDQSEEKKTG